MYLSISVYKKQQQKHQEKTLLTKQIHKLNENRNGLA